MVVGLPVFRNPTQPNPPDNPVQVRAEPLRFMKEGVFAVVKDLFLKWRAKTRENRVFTCGTLSAGGEPRTHARPGGRPCRVACGPEPFTPSIPFPRRHRYNAYRFLVQNAARASAESGAPFDPASADLSKATNILDRWIRAASHGLIAFVTAEMGAYRLYTVAPRLVAFIESLTNIYVRFNRNRLKGRGGAQDAAFALCTLCAARPGPRGLVALPAPRCLPGRACPLPAPGLSPSPFGGQLRRAADADEGDGAVHPLFCGDHVPGKKP